MAGIAPVTAWRYRRRGWLKTLNICGRIYVTGTALAEFLRRAEAGEFAVAPSIGRQHKPVQPSKSLEGDPPFKDRDRARWRASRRVGFQGSAEASHENLRQLGERPFPFPHLAGPYRRTLSS